MLLLSQAPGGTLSARRCPASSPLPSFLKSNSSVVSRHSKSAFPRRNPRKPPTLILASSSTTSDGAPGGEPAPSSSRSAPFPGVDDMVFVGEEGVPLEGVIQAEKPDSPSSFSSRARTWGKVALLAGGDVIFLLLFSALGRFSHGFPVLEYDTIRTADPFIAGWFLGAYFLGGYSEDGRGENGTTKAITAAAKSWAGGIPLGLAIRTMTSGHLPPSTFVLVSMGSTAVLMIGWRTLIQNLLRGGQNNTNDVYRRGNPFEFFELLASLVRRW